MSQQVRVLQNKKIFISICTLVLVILGVWWASSLLLNKNKAEKVKTQNVVTNESETIDISGNQILISPKQIQQAGIQLQSLGQATTDVRLAMTLQGQAQWSPESKVVLTSPVAGIVQQVLVQPLAQVGLYSPVLAIHSPDLIQIQNDILQIRAQLQLASQNLARERSLYAEGIIAEKRVQEVQNVVQRLNIDLSAKQRMLQFMGASSSQGLNPVVYVKSPARGSVESLQVSAGQYVETGAVLGQLVNSDLPLQLMLQAPLADSKYIQIGDLVKVEGCEITGQVQQIAPALSGNTQSQNVLVQMQAKDNCLKVQQFVKANIQSHNPTTKTAWVIPSAALTLKDNKHFIFIKNQNGFVATPVELVGANQQQSHVIGNALKPGIQVAVRGVERLKAVWSGFGAEQAPPASSSTAVN
ncbi:HlyD family efflux transporter periplasmic adaptor subunit [Acinetobacter sp. ANC 4216]|uniref:efflux RND transporter periplasmic adaptor subunit n=1 Tax=Acinetobacter sp. ANC 4216 TaxID=2529840 RepID=UPI00103A9EDA|nr:efflux RND transporter periplasmic adaptor subunit [Acinetobacter sp. ANC 4216]TCB70693.1 HlyD family efflux transporter periplasmic adaptor subunit [Acinetobacter sp. ANC 4216]